MVKLRTTPKSNTSSRIKDLNRVQKLGLVSAVLLGLTASIIAYQFRPGTNADGFVTSVMARITMGDYSALGDGFIDWWVDDASADTAEGVEPGTEQPKGKPVKPGIIKKVADFTGFSDYNLSTGKHPHEDLKDLVYVGDSLEDTRLLAMMHPILGKDYDSRNCESRDEGDVQNGDVVCDLPVGDLEHGELMKHCIRTYGLGSRLPFEFEWNIIVNSKHFKNYDMFAIWTMDIPPDAGFVTKDNFKIVFQDSRLDLDDYEDDEDESEMLTSVCVKPITLAEN